MEERQITVLEYVAEKLMIEAGWDPAERENSIEWDPNREDSQYAINLDIARVAVEATLEAISAIPAQEGEPDYNRALKGPQYPEKGTHKVLSNTTFISLEKDDLEDKILVGDLRHMLDLLDYYGVPDHYEVQSTEISICFENDSPFEQISRSHPSTLNKTEEYLQELEKNRRP